MAVIANYSRGITGYILILDGAITIIIGLLMFFFPYVIGDFALQQQTDGIHWHLIRCIGGQLLSSGFVLFKFGNRGPDTRTTCYILRLLTGILIFFFFYHEIAVNPELVHSKVSAAVLYINACIIGVYGLLLLKNGYQIGNGVLDSRVGIFLYQLDSIASITIGIAWIAYPNWLLHKQVKIELNDTHEFCGRLMGALFVSSQAISTNAIRWNEPLNRSLAAEARTLCCLFILFAQIWSQIAYHRDWSGGHWVGISLFSTWTIIAFFYRISIYYYTKKLKTLKNN